MTIRYLFNFHWFFSPHLYLCSSIHTWHINQMIVRYSVQRTTQAEEWLIITRNITYGYGLPEWKCHQCKICARFRLNISFSTNIRFLFHKDSPKKHIHSTFFFLLNHSISYSFTFKMYFIIAIHCGSNECFGRTTTTTKTKNDINIKMDTIFLLKQWMSFN